MKDKDRKQRLARRAAALRRYAERLKKAKAPRGADLARGFFKAAQACFPDDNTPGPEHAVWIRLVQTAIAILVSEGFSRNEVNRRLARALHPARRVSG